MRPQTGAFGRGVRSGEPLRVCVFKRFVFAKRLPSRAPSGWHTQRQTSSVDPLLPRAASNLVRRPSSALTGDAPTCVEWVEQGESGSRSVSRQECAFDLRRRARPPESREKRPSSVSPAWSRHRTRRGRSRRMCRVTVRSLPSLFPPAFLPVHQARPWSFSIEAASPRLASSRRCRFGTFQLDSERYGSVLLRRAASGARVLAQGATWHESAQERKEPEALFFLFLFFGFAFCPSRTSPLLSGTPETLLSSPLSPLPSHRSRLAPRRTTTRSGAWRLSVLDASRMRRRLVRRGPSLSFPSPLLCLFLPVGCKPSRRAHRLLYARPARVRLASFNRAPGPPPPRPLLVAGEPVDLRRWR